MSHASPPELEQIEELEQIDLTVEEEPSGPTCKNCGQPNSNPVCRKCGYYELLGEVIELAPWDQVDEEDAEIAPPQPSHLQVWLNIIPWWAWPIMACVLAVVAESIAAAVLLPEGSGLRMRWSLWQLFGGFMLALVVHTWAYITALMQDSDYNLLDILIKPIAVWKPVVQQLPGSWPRLSAVSAGLAAILCSLLIIRSIPYERLWDWGPKKKAKVNLLGAVMDQAKKLDGESKELDEAAEDFTGKADLEAEAEKEKPRMKTECVIVGYTTKKSNPRQIQSLVVASDVGGKLKIVGFVSAGMPPHIRAELSQRLRKIGRRRPFVQSELLAHWVEPIVTCDVSCTRRATSGHLVEPLFERLLQEIDL